MELLSRYVCEIMLGLSGTFLTLFIKGYQSLMGRIKKLEEKALKMQGEIDLNTAFDLERNKSK